MSVCEELLAGSVRSREEGVQRNLNPWGGSTVPWPQPELKSTVTFGAETVEASEVTEMCLLHRPSQRKWKRQGKHESLHKLRDQYPSEGGEWWKFLEALNAKSEISRRKALGLRVWLW